MERLSSQILRDNWWVLLIRGIAAILFGIIALAMPGLTAYVLVIAFGAYTLVDGIMAIYLGFKRRGNDDAWWTWIIDGILSIVIGLVAMIWTSATAVVFIIWIAAWAIVVGIMRIIAAIRLRKEIEGEWALILSGLLMIIWGVLIAMTPAAGLLSIAWLLGIFSFMVGVMMVVLAFRARRLPAQA